MKKLFILAMAIILLTAPIALAKDKKPGADKMVQERITVLKNTIQFASEKLRLLSEQYKNFANVKVQAERELKVLELKEGKKKK